MGVLVRWQPEAGASNDVDGSAEQIVDFDVFQGALMAALEDDMGGLAGLPCLLPAGSTETPAIARLQTRKTVLGSRRTQVVSTGRRKREELVGHDGANRVTPAVVVGRVATTVAEKASDRTGRTRQEHFTKDVSAGGALMTTSSAHSSRKGLFPPPKQSKPLLFDRGRFTR